jgi:hypothetical protein
LSGKIAKHECPLCKGSGKVTARIAKSKISTRDREKFNASMREVNKRARERAKLKELV